MISADLVQALNEKGEAAGGLEDDYNKIKPFFAHERGVAALPPKRIAAILGFDIEKRPGASADEQDFIRRQRQALAERLNALKEAGYLKETENGSYVDAKRSGQPKSNHTHKRHGHKPHHEDGIVTGVLHQFNTYAELEPLDGDSPAIRIDLENMPGSEGDIITASLDTFNKVSGIVKRHGNMNDENALGKLSALSHGIPVEFPEGILEGVDLSEPKPGPKLKDFTWIPFISIDPSDAKDKDDVICARRKKGGGWVLYVGVASVSDYVKPGTKLYHEAVKRGNSTYLVDGVIPMLPEELSNGICSLHPNVNRLATVCTMEIDKDGSIASYKFEKGVIRSRAELTYEEVQAAIDGDKSHILAKDRRLWGYILPALEVCNARLKDKKRRNALAIDTTQQRVSIGRSRDVSIALEVGNEAHNIIEEAMIAANICAAEALPETILRVHGAPREEVLFEYADALKELGIIVPKKGDMKDKMQYIAGQIARCADPDEGYTLLTRMQTMAHYSAEDGEHWALGLKRYTHKTSPIRRIVDLIVDYGLNALPGMSGPTATREVKDKMVEIAGHASMTERRSQRAEMDCQRRYLAMWLRENSDKTFEARVTRVNGKKIWVSVEQSGLEIKTAIDRKDLPNPVASYAPKDRIIIKPYEANPITGIIKFRAMNSGDADQDADIKRSSREIAAQVALSSRAASLRRPSPVS